MVRRELLGVLSAGAAGLVALSGATARGDEGHEHDGHIKILNECAKVCNEASHHCLGEVKKGGPHAEHHAKANIRNKERCCSTPFTVRWLGCQLTSSKHIASKGRSRS